MRPNLHTDHRPKRYVGALLLPIALGIILGFENWSFWVGIAFTAILIHFLINIAVYRLASDERSLRQRICGKEE